MATPETCDECTCIEGSPNQPGENPYNTIELCPFHKNAGKWKKDRDGLLSVLKGMYSGWLKSGMEKVETIEDIIKEAEGN